MTKPEIDAEGLAAAHAAVADRLTDPTPDTEIETVQIAIRAYLAATRTSEAAEPVADTWGGDFVDAAEGIGLYCGGEPNDEVADRDPMEAALDAFLTEHPLPYVEGKSPRVALAAAIRAYLAPARTVITGIEQASHPSPVSEEVTEAAVWAALEAWFHDEIHYLEDGQEADIEGWKRDMKSAIRAALASIRSPKP